MRFKNRELLIGQAWQDQPLSTTDKYFHVDLPGAARLLRIRDVQLLCRCMQIPIKKKKNKKYIFNNFYYYYCYYISFIINNTICMDNLLTFLHDRTIFFKSYSADKP